jgi:excisionase family DNA binding protein
MTVEKQILTTAEAATFLGVSVKTLKRLNEDGFVKNLRGFKKPFRFARRELERYLAA